MRGCELLAGLDPKPVLFLEIKCCFTVVQMHHNSQIKICKRKIGDVVRSISDYVKGCTEHYWLEINWCFSHEIQPLVPRPLLENWMKESERSSDEKKAMLCSRVQGKSHLIPKIKFMKPWLRPGLHMGESEVVEWAAPLKSELERVNAFLNALLC